MRHETDHFPAANLPPFLFDAEDDGENRVYFVTDIPILHSARYKDKRIEISNYNMDNIAKAKVIHIGVAGRRIVKTTKTKVYLGDTSIVSNIIQLTKSAAKRKSHDYPLLKLVYQIAQGDLSLASKKIKLHIHESARFASRLEAMDYAESLKCDFLPIERRRMRYKFLQELAASNIYGDQTTPEESHAEKLTKELDDEIF